MSFRSDSGLAVAPDFKGRAQTSKTAVLKEQRTEKEGATDLYIHILNESETGRLGEKARCPVLGENWGGSIIDAIGTLTDMGAILNQLETVSFGHSGCSTRGSW